MQGHHLAADADVSKGSATGDPDLGLHQIHPCDLLRACVLHLRPDTTQFTLCAGAMQDTCQRSSLKMPGLLGQYCKVPSQCLHA